MDIKSEGQVLLDFHKLLYEQLIEIPENREMTYVEEIKKGIKVGNPVLKIPNINGLKTYWLIYETIYKIFGIFLISILTG